MDPLRITMTFTVTDGDISSELRQKIEMVEKCIATALRANNLTAVIEFHKKGISLLETAKLSPHQVEISLRNSFQFSLWRWIVQKLSKISK